MALRYITLIEIQNAIPNTVQGFLSDDSPQGEFADQSILEHFAYVAEQEFESYITARYDLPIKATDGTIPVSVKNAILAILKYHLYARRNALSPSIESQYTTTTAWLQAVRNGNADIPTIDASGTVSSTGNLIIGANDQNYSKFSDFV
jgi:phage gp36-like protein